MAIFEAKVEFISVTFKGLLFVHCLSFCILLSGIQCQYPCKHLLNGNRTIVDVISLELLICFFSPSSMFLVKAEGLVFGH